MIYLPFNLNSQGPKTFVLLEEINEISLEILKLLFFWYTLYNDLT